jgi:hypothetical protein
MPELRDIIKKHALISMSNGSVLEGFVDEMDGGFLNLVEINNMVVLVRLDDISFVRINMPALKKYESEPMAGINPPEESVAPVQDDFSMAMPKPDDSTYRQPSFVRSTE